MNVLEEFWYGNIEPTEYDAIPNKEYKELLQLISQNEERLLATMTDTQKELSAVILTVYGSTRQWLSVCFFRTASALVQR